MRYVRVLAHEWCSLPNTHQRHAFKELGLGNVGPVGEGESVKRKTTCTGTADENMSDRALLTTTSNHWFAKNHIRGFSSLDNKNIPHDHLSLRFDDQSLESEISTTQPSKGSQTVHVILMFDTMHFPA